MKECKQRQDIHRGPALVELMSGKKFICRLMAVALCVFAAASARAQKVQISFDGTLDWVAPYWKTPAGVVAGSEIKGNVIIDPSACDQEPGDDPEKHDPINGGYIYNCPSAILSYTITTSTMEVVNVSTTGVYVWFYAFNNGASQATSISISSLNRETLPAIPFFGMIFPVDLAPNQPGSNRPGNIKDTLGLLFGSHTHTDNLALSLPGQAPTTQTITLSPRVIPEAVVKFYINRNALGGVDLSWSAIAGKNLALYQLESLTSDAIPVPVPPVRDGDLLKVSLPNVNGSALFFKLKPTP